MANSEYRPWGRLDWVIKIGGVDRWHFVGCLGPEERSIISFIELSLRDKLSGQVFLQIEEESVHSVEALEAIRLRKESGFSVGLTESDISLLDLFASMEQLDGVCSASEESVILDITSLPKRIFFFLLKKYFNSDSVRNLLITYTLPKSYPSGAISGDYDPWDPLPTFQCVDPDDVKNAHKKLIVNVGFMPEGINDYLARAKDHKVQLLVPFPASVSAYQRSWLSVLALSSEIKEDVSEIRVPMHDMSEAFNVILSLVNSGQPLASFAPFGPKPISAAMCLYASLTGSPVYYAQPKKYAPNYSVGVAETHGVKEIYGYWVKHGGRRLYEA